MPSGVVEVRRLCAGFDHEARIGYRRDLEFTQMARLKSRVRHDQKLFF